MFAPAFEECLCSFHPDFSLSFFLKARLNPLETTQAHRRNLSHVVTVRLSVSRIVTDHAAVVARINQVIDV
jgi:outer membrane cobalamin receptor